MKISITNHQSTLEDTILSLQNKIKDLEFNLELSHKENDRLKCELVKLGVNNAIDKPEPTLWWGEWPGLNSDGGYGFKLPELRGQFLTTNYLDNYDGDIKATGFSHSVTDPGHNNGFYGSSNMNDSASVTGAPVVVQEDPMKESRIEYNDWLRQNWSALKTEPVDLDLIKQINEEFSFNYHAHFSDSLKSRFPNIF